MSARVPMCALVLSCLASLACGDSKSPTSPSSPPAPTTASLTGTVSAQGGARLTGATVVVLDGPNANRSVATNGNGEYRFEGLTTAGMNFAARAIGYEEARGGVIVDGTKTLNFTLRTAAPWSKTGVGLSVFDMPTYITRVRIIGTYTGSARTSLCISVVGAS
jgi:hypothetical protein